MSTAVLTLRQFRYNNKAFWRNPAAAFFTFAFPIMFLVIFNALFGNAEFFVPGIAAFGIVSACYTNIAITVTVLREEGVLKRVRGTPLPPSSYLIGRVLHAIFLAYVLVAIIALFGAVFYDVDLPTSTLAPFILSIAVEAASFCALGLAMTSLIPNTDAAPAIVNALVIPTAFISDVWAPYANAPPWLQAIADFLPMKHAVDTMKCSFLPGECASAYQWFDLGIVVAWGVFGLAAAVLRFRWEPRR
ncbi:MAG: ABC transporter permease [Actinobacteria bacterium]|nr:ABC transporter permease [Actinomycetota bacterium]